ncbi:hypothetical protein A5819_003731 [Enterococcus sp. 7E2_DIV0204]|uniref:hypothetical protein n=1 Tax=unclassified Enterococcus TaxID=2608891 RepID=UPI000A33D03C|nr:MULTISPECIES: hypothetical protein [unclassified Enterococcus]OTN83751.1 hypothetical protein A5819_003731 [Enterococcus sp. 7E2_DIV0204]OTP47122.1 hypothetical protein A5884_003659 [Enterococcus sp. 7D2_DIV0200]
MNDSKNEWKKSLIEFLFLFVIYETMLLFGAFILIKMIFVQSLNLPIIGYMFENVKESIQQLSFIDFLHKAKGISVLLTYFSTILAFGSIE